MYDAQTHDYFENFTPHYIPERFDFACDYLNEFATKEQTVLDIGCGDGATLSLLKNKTPLEKIVGLDISKNYLKKAKKLTQCDILQGSILNPKNLEKHWGTFDYCVLGAVLHHLIGNNRKESFQYAQLAVENAIKLLKPGGSLIIFEPTHAPSLIMTMIFWIKKTISIFSSERIELSTRWANIGQPIVSYYTPKQLDSFIENLPSVQVIKRTVVDEKRLGLIIKREGIGFIITKMGRD